MADCVITSPYVEKKQSQLIKHKISPFVSFTRKRLNPDMHINHPVTKGMWGSGELGGSRMGKEEENKAQNIDRK